MDIIELRDYVNNWPDGWGKSRPSLLVNKLYESGFNIEQIKDIIDAIDSTCHHCWDGTNRCQCWNDE